MIPSARVLLLALALALPAQALRVRSFTLPELVQESAVIVRGTVVASRGAWSDAKDTLYTDATVRVDERLYARAPTVAPELTVRQPGGTVDGTRAVISGVRYLQPGEHVVLFLRTDGVRYYLIGFSQSIWTVDAQGVGRAPAAPGLELTGRPAPAPVREPLPAFRARIAALVGQKVTPLRAASFHSCSWTAPPPAPTR